MASPLPIRSLIAHFPSAAAVLGLLFSLCFTLAGAVLDFEQYQAVTWTTEHGLPRGEVSYAEQTDDGYLWISTRGGLSRFDGQRFETFNNSNTPELKDAGTDRLLKDRRGNLWIGNEGIVRWNPADGFSRFDIPVLTASGAFPIEFIPGWDGYPLVLRRNVLFQFDGTRFNTIATNGPAKYAYWLLQDATGRVLQCSLTASTDLIVDHVRPGGGLEQLFTVSGLDLGGTSWLVEWAPGEFAIPTWPVRIYAAGKLEELPTAGVEAGSAVLTRLSDGSPGARKRPRFHTKVGNGGRQGPCRARSRAAT